MVDAVGLDVAHGAELEADRGSAWTLHFPTTQHHVWVATRWTPVRVGRGAAAAALRPGTAALLAPGAPRWVGTATLGDAPPPRVTVPDLGIGVSPGITGIHHGTAAFGPLMPEAFALPDLVTTARHPAADVDVSETLQHIDDQVGHRWPGPQRDALARMLVVTVLDAWRPPVLRDNSLTRSVNAIAEALQRPGQRPGPTVPDLAAVARVSQSTLLRRFRATTGMTPDEFARWLRTLAVRTALRTGTDPAVAAPRYGYPSVAAMRRSVRRVESSAARLPRPGPHDHFPF